uniref:Methyltransferase n=1 Tax=Cucumis sativus TaxID=3659 RepID=A0A0A0KP65_CUCSA
MAISLPTFFQERKFPFLFTLSLLLVCFLFLFFTDSLTLNPLVRTYSSLRSPSSSSSPTTHAVHLNPSSSDFSSSFAHTLTWKLCDGSVAVDFIPCLDNSKAIKALQSRKHMEHRERHCPRPSPRCLIPLPLAYKVPVPWPKSRDMIWYDNVPHPKLVEYKKDQHWVVKVGEYLNFPGGGTQFKDGVDRYINFIQETLSDIKWGENIRVILDVGCGVASFGGYLLQKNVLAMSFAPKDEHEAQIQFALERGIPATLSVIGTQRLTFPDNAYDLIHCARCRVHWDADGGKPLLELNRILRPGGYFIWSATPVYRDDERDKNVWNAMVLLTKSMCWKVVKKTSDSSGTYAPLTRCISQLPVDNKGQYFNWPSPWPQRLTSKPPRLSVEPSAEEKFLEDTKQWSTVVSDVYLDKIGVNWSTVRNVLDMNAGYGGFAAALIDLPLWVMNVVPIDEPDTLSIIFDRGLIGLYHDWCESFNTYPRTYDLLHSSFLFTSLKKRCDVVATVVEMDRILRPGGYVLIRDNMEAIKVLGSIFHSLQWSVSVYQDQLLVGKKGFWRP